MTADERHWAARLRAERKARCWDVPEMARRLAQAAGAGRSDLPDHETLVAYIRRWEAARSGIRERYRLLYAAAFGIDEAALFGSGETNRSSLWRPRVTASHHDGVTTDDEERIVLAVQRPAWLDGGVIEALSTVLAGQRRLEDAIGPAALLAPVAGQLEAITGMVKDASGPLRDQFGRLVAEWTVYTGWLYAALRRDRDAVALFARAEDLADDFSDGTIAGIATSFRGYVARQQGRPRAVVRASCAALATPGGHPVQRTFDRLQAAQGYAALGEKDEARRLLDSAAGRASEALEPPPAVYWYSEPFFLLNIGIVHREIGEYGDAADLLARGLDGMPADQRGAEWLTEYRDAYTDSRQRS